jgi:hypothetical protein
MAMEPAGGEDGALEAPVRPPASAGRPLVRGLVLATGGGLVYLLIVGSFRFDFKQTDFPHHILTADAFLHGQLQIRPAALRFVYQRIARRISAELDEASRRTGHVPNAAERETYIQEHAFDIVTSDLADFKGRVYGYWAPLAAVAAMPFVALFGLGVSDQVINVLFGALNVGLFYWLLQRADRIGLCRTDEACRMALTLVLAFGTAHLWLTCAGQVWFAVQIVTLTAMLAALLVACSPADRAGRDLLSGAFFGTAILGRNIIALAGLFFVVLIWIRLKEAGTLPAGRLARRVTLFCAPVATAVVLQGVYNYARFEDPLESGLGVQVRSSGQERYQETVRQYGMFSFRYLPQNLWYYFVNWRFPRLDDGRIWVDKEGTSVFLATPPLLYALLAWRRRTPLVLALVCGVAPVLGALLLYFATGADQFGPRYLMDIMPLLLLLAALGMRGRLSHIGYTLVVLAIAANLFGTYRICQREFIPVSGLVTYWTLPALVAVALLARALAVWRRQRRQVAST